MRLILAARIETAPAYTVDRLTRELRQVLRRLGDIAQPTEPNTSPPAPTDQLHRRHVHVIEAIRAGATPDDAIAAADLIYPTPPGTRIEHGLTARRDLRRAVIELTAAMRPAPDVPAALTA